MGNWVISFVGLALFYAVLASGLILGLARTIGRGPTWHMLPLLLTTLFFVFLTQHPFPLPGTLNCPVPSAEPQLTPFGFLESARSLKALDASLWDYLANRTLAATTMNFLVCVAIGATFNRHVPSLTTALLFGLGLSLTAELTQLTGLWGVYPCAYRQFDVDDLIMNVLGVVCGAILSKIQRPQTHGF